MKKINIGFVLVAIYIVIVVWSWINAYSRDAHGGWFCGLYSALLGFPWILIIGFIMGTIETILGQDTTSLESLFIVVSQILNVFTIYYIYLGIKKLFSKKQPVDNQL